MKKLSTGSNGININTLTLFILFSTVFLVSCTQWGWPVNGTGEPKLPADNSGFVSPTSYSGYSLVWSDEFNESSLDANKWTPEDRGKWGNNQLQYYRPDNVSVSNGNLVLEAKKENYNGYNYTSGRISTKGGKFDFTYGRVDIRAKFTNGHGMWNSLWMVGTEGSTFYEHGEIDILELLGNNPSRANGTIHWLESDGTTYAQIHKAYDLPSGTFSDEYHVFSLIWTHDSIQILVDNNVYNTISTSSITDFYNGKNVFDTPFYLIFAMPVGGNWPGNPDGTTTWPQKMYVDYVRVFQKN